jgi:flagellar motor switch protein FliN/FliY
MATKKTPLVEDDILAMPGTDADLDQAIDDLRGVLKSDATGLPDLDNDFGMGSDFGGAAAPTDLSAFGGDDFGGASDFGGPASDFGGSSFGEPSMSMREPGSALTSNLDLIMDIPIDVQILLGTSRMQVSGLMNLDEGAIIALDKRIGEPVEIMVNGRRIGKGEITVLENDDTRFGVKLIEVLSTKKS